MKKFIPVLFLTACATPQEQLESVEVVVSTAQFDQDIGKRDGSLDGYTVGLRWKPFKQSPQKVIVVQATHAAAEAGLPPGEVSVPVGEPCGKPK